MMSLANDVTDQKSSPLSRNTRVIFCIKNEMAVFVTKVWSTLLTRWLHIFVSFDDISKLRPRTTTKHRIFPVIFSCRGARNLIYFSFPLRYAENSKWNEIFIYILQKCVRRTQLAKTNCNQSVKYSNKCWNLILWYARLYAFDHIKVDSHVACSQALLSQKSAAWKSN